MPGPRTRPVLYTFIALMGVGFIAVTVLTLVEQDWGQGIYLAGALSTFWFLYRNPKILFGPAFGRVAEMRAAADMEFLWLGLALMAASVLLF